MRKIIFSHFFLLVLTILISNAQSSLPIGQWKSHLSYKEGISITQSQDKIIYASSKGIITIDKEDISVTFLSKEDGLSDVNIRGLYYDQENLQLIIVYKDNNIDIIRDNDVINIPFTGISGRCGGRRRPPSRRIVAAERPQRGTADGAGPGPGQ